MKKLYVILLCLSYSSLFAQEDLTVIVTSYPDNQIVEGASVELSNDARGISFTERTDAQGRVIFSSLPVVGGYQVSVAETDDYLEALSPMIDLRSNQSRIVRLTLVSSQSTELDEVVLVGRSASQINRTDAEVSFELSELEIEALPIEGRDLTRVLYRLPNVSQATGFYPEAPNVSINGANSLFTSYLIDGMDNNERFLGGQKFAIPSGFAKNITVLTNNYSAEYGLTANGVVNVTTKSGTNELSGEAFFLSRPGPVIDASSPFAQRDLSGNFVRDGFQRYQGGVALGGAIVKNKTFFFVDLEHTTDLKDNLLNAPSLGVNETVRGMNNFTYLSGKIDHNWSANFRSSLRANVGLVNIERQGGGLEGGVTFPSAGNFQDRNSILIASKNTYVGTNWTSQTNIQYARFRWNYGRPVNENSPQVTVLDPSELTIAVLGHPGFVFDQTENTLQLQQKFKFYMGRHTLKTGFTVISADHQLFGGGNVNGNYTVQLTDAQLIDLRNRNLGADLGVNDLPADVQVNAYGVELRPTEFGERQTIYSIYVEDQWSATDRLNLTIGLRYDYDDLSQGGADQGDLNNIAPRLNANYQLTNASSLRFGYGIFYDKIPYAVYSDALQQNTTSAGYIRQLQALIDQGILPSDTDLDQITFDGNLGASLDRNDNVSYLNGPTPAELAEQRDNIFSNERRILNPEGYQNPFTHQFAPDSPRQTDG
ncbi:MAG: TonB-dependent receptor [Bacteroidota bacterium]